MRDPVTCCDGHSYERTAIAAWLSENSTSPKTNLPLLSKNIIPNHALRNSIETLKSLKEARIVEETNDDIIDLCSSDDDDDTTSMLEKAKDGVISHKARERKRKKTNP